jgi:hypothetical protein
MDNSARSWHDRMSDRLTPINVALDSVSFFVASVAWVFLVWCPILVAFLLFYLRKTLVVSAFIFLLFTAIFLPLGLLLRWLAHGMIERKRMRLGLSAIVLGLLGILNVFAPPFSQRHLGPRLIEQLGIGILLLCSAAIAAVGSTRSARWSDE